MIKKIFSVLLLSLITFTLNANAGEANYKNAVFKSAELKDGTDLKKTKVSLKNAEVTFKDGSVYIGPIKKNRLSGKGRLTISDGTAYEGKFKGNKLIIKNNKRERTYIKVDFGKKGISVQPQIKVRGLTKWYPAEEVNGEFKLSKKGELMASQDKAAQSGGGESGGSGC